MAGYIPQEREPMTREQWVAIVLSIAAGGLMLFIALYASKVASGWIGVIGQVPPAAPIMFVAGASFLAQRKPGPQAPEANRGWRFRRWFAAGFFLIGILMIAIPLIAPHGGAR